MATPPGARVTVLQTGAPNVPVPVPWRVQISSEMSQTTATSLSRSALRSPLATATAPTQPAGKLVTVNPPVQLLRRNERVSSPLFAVMTSGHPSLLKSATRIPLGLIPVLMELL